MSEMKVINLPRVRVGTLLLGLITVVSTGLSGYCGWMLAYEQHIAVKLLSAGSMSTIALLLALNTLRAAKHFVAEERAQYASAMRYCLVLFAANWVTDFNAASVLRDATNIASSNKNIVATQKLGEVKRIENRLSAIKSELKPYAATKTSGHYEAQLLTLKSTLGADGRNIWERSGHCGTKGDVKVTIKESQDHCAEIAQAKQGISDAVAKRRLQDERLALTQQLPAAKLESQGNQKMSNPVVAMIGNLITVPLQTFQHSDGQIRWGLLLFTMLYTLIFSYIIFRESWGSAVADARENKEAQWARNEWLPDHRPQAARDTARGAASVSLNTTVFADDNTEVLRRAVRKAKEMAA